MRSSLFSLILERSQEHLSYKGYQMGSSNIAAKYKHAFVAHVSSKEIKNKDNITYNNL